MPEPARTAAAYPRSVLVGIGAHVGDTAVIYIFATFSVAYIADELGLSRMTALTGIVLSGLLVIALQPVYGALSDRIGRRPLNLFSAIFTALYAFPYFLLLDSGSPAVIWLATAIGLAIGLGPMIAVQPAFYAEMFGARVRYTGFAASRELGAAWMAFASLVSLVAFLASVETKDMDLGVFDPGQEEIVTPALSGAPEVGATR